ncbi:MAG: hypothetical protein E6R04_05500 [Spirochaetes bacterium]|nr:MAG: hypothetical protein E6R04_05500 [Spirochaetota bacterium]
MKTQNRLKKELNHAKLILSTKTLKQDDIEKTAKIIESLLLHLISCESLEIKDTRNMYNSCSFDGEWQLETLFPADIKYATLEDIKYYYEKEIKELNLSVLQVARLLRNQAILSESTTIRHNNRTIRASKVLKHAKTPNSDLF